MVSPSLSVAASCLVASFQVSVYGLSVLQDGQTSSQALTTRMGPKGDPFSTASATDTLAGVQNALSFTVINRHPKNVSYGFRIGYGSPRTILLDGAEAEGIIPPNETIGYAIPTNYHGVLWLIDADYNSSQSDTLIESNFGRQEEGYNRLTLDVSMVDGFTLPATCSCKRKVVTGCSLNLFELNDCPEELQGPGTCRNPLRSEEDSVQAVEFFNPCQGMAYTFPADHASISNMEHPCLSGITCCIGTDCPPHPRQDEKGDDNDANEQDEKQHLDC